MASEKPKSEPPLDRSINRICNHTKQYQCVLQGIRQRLQGSIHEKNITLTMSTRPRPTWIKMQKTENEKKKNRKVQERKKPV